MRRRCAGKSIAIRPDDRIVTAVCTGRAKGTRRARRSQGRGTGNAHRAPAVRAKRPNQSGLSLPARGAPASGEGRGSRNRMTSARSRMKRAHPGSSGRGAARPNGHREARHRGGDRRSAGARAGNRHSRPVSGYRRQRGKSAARRPERPRPGAGSRAARARSSPSTYRAPRVRQRARASRRLYGSRQPPTRCLRPARRRPRGHRTTRRLCACRAARSRSP